MIRQRTSLAKPVYAAAICLAALGCGDGRPDRVPVSGRVTVDGAPLTYGFIRFVPTGARPSTGTLDSEGRFTLECYDGEDGAVLGSHRIEVAAGQSLSATRIRWHAPKKYADFTTSGLTEEVSEPTDSLEIELTWNGGKPFVESLGGESGGDNAPPSQPATPEARRRE